MALKFPAKYRGNKTQLARRWRQGFWHCRNGGTMPTVPPDKPPNLQEIAFADGFKDGAASPGLYAPECWSEADLIEMALSAAGAWAPWASERAKTEDAKARVLALGLAWKDLAKKKATP